MKIQVVGIYDHVKRWKFETTKMDRYYHYAI